MAPPSDIDPVENERKMRSGELYYAFLPNLCKQRDAAAALCREYNAKHGTMSRRQEVEMLNKLVNLSVTKLPPVIDDQEQDAAQFGDFPIVLPPIMVDYGRHTFIGKQTFVNFSMTILDTCDVHIGDRVLFGPNCSIYAATHPLDPEIRDGLNGPEGGKPITIENDCWLAGHVIVYANIGQGSTIGAGSVVVHDVPPYSFAAGNPARVIRRIDCPASRRYYGDKFDDLKSITGTADEAQAHDKA